MSEPVRLALTPATAALIAAWNANVAEAQARLSAGLHMLYAERSIDPSTVGTVQLDGTELILHPIPSA